MRRIPFVIALAVAGIFSLYDSGKAQALHQIEGRVRSRSAQLRDIHVRLVSQADMRPISETFTNAEGQFKFSSIREGDYLIETYETDQLEATSTKVNVFPPNRAAPTPNLVMVFVELPLKAAKRASLGVVEADVDLAVPKEAQKHYRDGMKALDSTDSARALTELREAITIYPKYYAARLALGRELRLQKKFDEAANTLEPLRQIAPNKSEPRIEYGIVLINLARKQDAARELTEALRLQETNCAAHLYLGWALLEADQNSAEQHFKRALELDEQKAVRAHIALGQIANNKGLREEAVKHLVAYLTLAPNASDAEAVRKLAESLRK